MMHSHEFLHFAFFFSPCRMGRHTRYSTMKLAAAVAHEQLPAYLTALTLKASLIPRPSSRPVFDRLQYEKWMVGRPWSEATSQLYDGKVYNVPG